MATASYNKMATASYNHYNAPPPKSEHQYQNFEMFQQPYHKTPMTSETQFIQTEEPSFYPHDGNVAASEYNGSEIGTPWETGFWKQFPWLGMTAIAGVLGCEFPTSSVSVAVTDRDTNNQAPSLVYTFC